MRNVNPKRLGRLEVYDELVLGRRLHRQIGRLLALEDTVDVASSAAELVENIEAVRDQTAGVDIASSGIDRRYMQPGRQRDDQIAVNRPSAARRHDQTTVRRAGEAGNGALDLAGILHIDRDDLRPDGRSYGLDDRELPGSGGCRGITQDGSSRHARRDLLEQLQPLAAQAVFELNEAGRVATRPRQALYEAGADR